MTKMIEAIVRYLNSPETKSAVVDELSLQSSAAFEEVVESAMPSPSRPEAGRS